jgi:hypothetical protein
MQFAELGTRLGYSKGETQNLEMYDPGGESSERVLCRTSEEIRRLCCTCAVLEKRQGYLAEILNTRKNLIQGEKRGTALYCRTRGNND